MAPINTLRCAFYLTLVCSMTSSATEFLLSPIPLNLTSEPSGSIYFGDSIEDWIFNQNQTFDHLSASFTPQAVFRINLTLGDVNNIPSSIKVKISSNNSPNAPSWMVVFNKTCNDDFIHWINSTVLTQCVTYIPNSDLVTVSSDQRVFAVVNSSNGNLVWWQPFSSVDVTVNGLSSDFATAGSTFSIRRLLILGWTTFDSSACNCDPTGLLESAASPVCSTCQCRAGNPSSATCSPVITPSDAGQMFYGPVAGGTIIMLQGSFLRNPSSVKIGDFIDCQPMWYPSTDQKIVCVAPPLPVANSSLVGKSMPIHVCWSKTHVTSQRCVITKQEFTYRSEPTVNTISRSTSLEKGGLSLTISGENFDSINNYSDVVIKELTPLPFNWPYIDIYVLKNTETRFPINKSPQRCDVIDSKTIQCVTPEVIDNAVESYTSNSARYTVRLEICFGFYAEWYNSTPPYNCEKKMPFMVYTNPTVIPFDGVQLFRAYSGDTIFSISGNSFLRCCEKGDYSVTVGDLACQINEVYDNVIEVIPPQGPWPQDDFQSSTVLLHVGDYDFTVGSMRYASERCDDPANHCAALIGGLAGGVGGFLVIVIVVAIILLCVHFERRAEREEERKRFLEDPLRYIINGLNNEGLSKIVQSNLVEDIEKDHVREKVKLKLVPHSRLELRKHVGHGQFGVVYEGVYTDDANNKHIVAVKVAQVESYKARLDLLKEACDMVYFDHRNVLSLLAITIDNDKPHVILPFMDLGDLLSYVIKKKKALHLKDLLDFGKQVAEGMHYLAEMKFVHRDLAARNCMLNSDMLVKVADFGLARDIDQKDYYVMENAQPLPLKWMSRECLCDRPIRFTTQSDVWSFGVLLWELLMYGEKPFKDMDMREFPAYINDGHRLAKPPIASQAIYDLMLLCWDVEMMQRPRFDAISAALQSFLDQINHQTTIPMTQPVPPSAPHQLEVYGLPRDAVENKPISPPIRQSTAFNNEYC